MKLTNRMGLPQAVVDAVRNDGYSRGESDISVTQLCDSPRVAVLTDKHQDEIVEDASERIFSLLGQCIHTLLERANKVAVAERRLKIEIEGWTISGGMDLFDEGDGILSDYKVTSVWAVNKGIKEEWISQLNCYAHILRSHSHTVNGLRIIAIMRDWSVNDAARDPSYPQTQVATFDIPLWSVDQAEKYMRERVILHKQARVEIPLCSQKERWAHPDTFAVMKQGGKRAINGGIYEVEESAVAHAAQLPGHYVEKRPGRQVRCANYCRVARFCEQYQVLQDAGRDDWSKPSPLGQGKTG
jgi:hypothetical protein